MLVALLGVAGAIAAATVAGIVAIFVNARTADTAIHLDSRNAARLQKQPFLQKQLELLFEASEVAASLATSISPEAFQKAHDRFLELYWGPLSVVENTRVSSLMIEFWHALAQLPSDPLPPPLEVRGMLRHVSYKLAKEVRLLILDMWEIRELEPSLDTDKEKSPPVATAEA